jgi:predicted regulator of Ras-like GTPase activity (Roadblock/LC7/MglB family)
MALSVKFPFAGLFRGFFRRSEPLQSAATPVAPSNSNQAKTTNTAKGGTQKITTLPAAVNEIELPLASVLNGLPMELRAKIMSSPSARATIKLQAEPVVAQLASGSVKISFGELRKLAPGIFANTGGEHDSRTVNLPLPEILARVNPALLTRRSAKKLSASEEIAGPFGDRTNTVQFTTAPLKAPAAAPAPAQPVVQVQLAPAPKPVTPTQNFEAPPLEPSAPISFAPRAIAPVASAPVEMPRFAMPDAVQSGGMIVQLVSLAESWPAAIKEEIYKPTFANASVTLPKAIVEAGLKVGRVVMTWKQIRTLAAPNSPASHNDAAELQLPLKIVAPMFLLTKKNGSAPQQKVSVKSEIPDLFFGFPQPAAAPAVPGLPPLPKPSAGETNYFTTGVQSMNPAAEVATCARPVENLQTDFASRQTAPKEAIAHAMKLPGVAGAVVALPDGLRVASEVSGELNADTLAAFLPQIFERVNQSTRELRMGALNNVSFTVGDVPWKIFRVNSVYFAAFGRAGESLPSAQLVQLAAAIDRKK